MNEYERKNNLSNPYSLSFGAKPFIYIERNLQQSEIIQKITAKTPISHSFVIAGVRGSGKTVMLTSIGEHFEGEKDWIVVDLNPEDDLREGLAAKLYRAAHVKHLFLEKNFSFSFQGISFSLKGKNPILNIDDLLEKMMQEIQKQGKKVLVTVDEATNSKEMKQFSLSFQMLIRRDYPLFLIVTSLYENISALENEKNMTFLIRSQKFFLTPLGLQAITNSYKETLELDYETALSCAKLTKGYAFAFQLLGYLMFEKKAKNISDDILLSFDQLLEEYVYNKIWSTLSEVEKSIVKVFNTNGTVDVSKILEATNMKKEYFSRYRERLLKKGILICPNRGKLIFALPRFKEFIDVATSFDF